MRSTDDFFVTRFRGAFSRRAIGIENISASQFFSVKIRLAEYCCSPFRVARGGNAPKVHYGDAVGRGDVLRDRWGEFYVWHTRVESYLGASRKFHHRAQTSEYPCLHRSSPKARGSDDAHLRYSDHHASVPRRNIGHLMNWTKIFFFK